MTPRDQKAVALAAAVLLLFGFARFLLLPLWTDAGRLKKAVAAQKRQLAEMRVLAQGRTAGQNPAIPLRPEHFTLFAFLDQAAADSRIKDRIRAMQPVPVDDLDADAARLAAVELQVQGVGLRQLAHFLDLVDTPENLVAVERLTIQGGQDGAPLDLSLRVVAVDGAEAAP